MPVARGLDRRLIGHACNKILPVPVQTAYGAGVQRGSVSRGLRPEFFEQVRARNPIAERGIIVGVGNERGTTVAAIDHNGAAAEPG